MQITQTMLLTKEILAAKAFDIFRDWTNNAELFYPELTFTIIDETLLVKDLKKALTAARNNLYKEEKRVDRSKEGYDYGYMLGYIRSTLNVQWMNEYIRKQLPDYKEFVAMKAIKNYLVFDKVTSVRISAIYKHLMNNDTNINDLSLDIPLTRINLSDLDELEPETEDQIVVALNNKINKYIIEFLKEDPPDLVRPIQYYFSEEEMVCIINQQISY